MVVLLGCLWIWLFFTGLGEVLDEKGSTFFGFINLTFAAAIMLIAQ